MAATVFQSPLPKFQFFVPGQEATLAGGKLFTYASGTTTKLATYTDFAGTTPNTNPIILDVNGQCDVWLLQGSTYTFVLSPPTDTDPPSNPFWTENGITGINDISGSGGGGGTGGIVVQTGDVKFFGAGGGNLAAGWLLCTGAPVSRTTYATLFNAIGTTWGIGDGSTTFNLPDLRGRVPAGADNMGGSAANRITVASISTNAPAVLGASGGSQLSQTDTITVTVTDNGHFHATPGAVSGSGSAGAFGGATSSAIDTLTAVTGIAVAATSGLLGNQQNVQPTVFGNWAIWSGDNLTNSLAVQPATTLTLGGVIIGPGVTVDAGGTITVAPGAGGVTAVVAGAGLEVGGTPGGTITTTGTMTLLPATTGTFGGVVIGTGLAVSSGTASNAGVLDIGGQTGAVAVGSGLSATGGVLANSGVLAIGATNGSIALGSNLSMSEQTLTISGLGTGSVTNVATGTGLTGGPITTAGTISIAAATATSLGGVIPGANMSVNGGGTLSITAGTVTTLTSGAGISFSPSTITTAGTISNSGVLAVGATAGSIVLGTNLAMSGQTLNASGGSGTVTSIVAGAGLTGGTITAAGTIALGIPVPIADGGTNATTATSARVNVNIGTVTVTPAGANFTITPTFGSSNVVLATMTSSGTLANPTGLAAGQTDILVINAGTSGTLTLAYGSAYLFNSPFSNASPPAIGAGNNVLSIVSPDGTNCLSVLQPGTFV